jgi:hypothetical protein
MSLALPNVFLTGSGVMQVGIGRSKDPLLLMLWHDDHPTGAEHTCNDANAMTHSSEKRRRKCVVRYPR